MDAIEEYVMGVRMSRAARADMAEHFRVCGDCRRKRGNATLFVAALREAFSAAEGRPEFDAVLQA